MNLTPRAPLVLAAWLLFLASAAVFAEAPAAEAPPAASAPRPYEPTVGQPGRDVVWVPTPPVLVEKMLDMANVTANDFVVDLGSGDGRNVIAAARRGARALGVEYNLDLVELSQRLAEKEGVADRAKFVQGDMYEADISGATVLALFLLTENLDRLVPKFLDLEPGARIVVNGFGITGWNPDETGQVDGDCGNWCVAYLFIVPARVAGLWQFQGGELILRQHFQQFLGTLQVNGVSHAVKDGRLRGKEITFTVGGAAYAGRVEGDRMGGTVLGSGRTWQAVRKQ
jgi:SAM-dependent methyltransferase